MIVNPTEIADVLLIEPRTFGDERGFFFESWNERDFSEHAELGLDARFVQDNHSRSRRGCLRGLHYQVNRPQGKLVRVAVGRIFDVAVDLRKSSPTYGRWVGVWLDGEKPTSLWIPPGFAHGFYVASEQADFVYKCTDFYSAGDDRTVSWNDPEIGIDWPLAEGEVPIVSAKDAAGTPFAEADVFA